MIRTTNAKKKMKNYELYIMKKDRWTKTNRLLSLPKLFVFFGEFLPFEAMLKYLN